jgi:hypothetical protein
MDNVHRGCASMINQLLPLLRIVRFNSELSIGTQSPPAKLSVFAAAKSRRRACDAVTVGRGIQIFTVVAS